MDRWASRATLLTTPSLGIATFPPSSTPTTSQLFSNLASNPDLRQLSLYDAALPDEADLPASQVPLRDLKKLSLTLWIFALIDALGNIG